MKCIKCGAEYPAQLLYRCERCGGILDILYDFERIRDRIDFKVIVARRDGMWNYRELLPIEDYSKIVSLGEGGTKLHRCSRLEDKFGIKQLYVKDETRNPTGSFKDRPISVAVTKAKEFGVNTVVTSSSGNAGASLSAYAAKAGITCFVFTPTNVALGPLSQMAVHGARIVTVKGSVSDSFKIAQVVAKKYGWMNVTSTFLCPYATEGDKTVGYEICEQLEWKVPQWILIPIGAGPLLFGSFKGFTELVKFDLIRDLPRMVGIQAEGCAPIVKAFKERTMEVRPWKNPKTIASGISDPLRGYTQDGNLTLKIIRKSKGVAIAVSDEDILDAVKLLAKEGVFAEPTGAVSIAGLRKMIDDKIVDRHDLAVCVVTGHGLKNPNRIMDMLKEPRLVVHGGNGLKRSSIMKILENRGDF